MRLVAATVFSVLSAAVAFAGEAPSCDVADHLVQADYPMARVAAAIDNKQLTIVVIGTSSSMIGSSLKAYPARLEDDLKARLVGVDVKVKSLAKAHETAADAEKTFERMIAEEQPALVIWQTGTVDAIRGIDLDDFRIAISDGIETLQDAKIDVVLMNMQYSPRTDAMIALGSYADTMRMVAVQHEIALFDRLAIMKQWNELGTFDLYSATKKTDVAEHVHQCIGHLLGDLVIEAAKQGGKPGKDLN